MAHVRVVRFLQPITLSRFPIFAKFARFDTLMKSIETPSLHNRCFCSNLKSYVQRYLHKSNLHNSVIENETISSNLWIRGLAVGVASDPIIQAYAREFSMGRLCGMSIVLGSVGLWPRFASSMDVYDKSSDDHRMSFDASDSEETSPAFFILLKKLLAPVVLLYIVWMNWGHPASIAVKAMLILLSTKPSPLSVYVLIDQWQRHYKDQHPLLYKFKSLYAKKVEVEDFAFLCIARVELYDQKFTLVGILGSWWVFERTTTSLQGAFSSFRNRAMEILKPVAIV